jgi:peptide deformylase
MKIVTAPHPALAKISRSINNIDQEAQKLAKSLVSSLANKGIGLAAPQIGQNKTIFVINLPQKEAEIFINPTIISHSKKKQHFYLSSDQNHQENHQRQPFLEGCLSLPHLYGTVKRWPEIEACWLNIDGQKNKKTLTELEAIVFQHELDHLRGKLFPQRIKKEGGQFFQEKNDQLKEISPQKVAY